MRALGGWAASQAARRRAGSGRYWERLGPPTSGDLHMKFTHFTRFGYYSYVNLGFNRGVRVYSTAACPTARLPLPAAAARVPAAVAGGGTDRVARMQAQTDISQSKTDISQLEPEPEQGAWGDPRGIAGWNSLVSGRAYLHPFDAGCVPLDYGGNPGGGMRRI